MSDFLSFRRMITPIIIQIIFWIFAIGLFALGLYGAATANGDGTQIAWGVIVLILGPLAVRVWCEVLILFFRMNETITDIKHNTKK